VSLTEREVLSLVLSSRILVPDVDKEDIKYLLSFADWVLTYLLRNYIIITTPKDYIGKEKLDLDFMEHRAGGGLTTSDYPVKFISIDLEFILLRTLN